jgi:hypothetical protein
MPGKKESIRKPPMTADQRGRRTGIGNTDTLGLGLSMVSAPPKAKMAPEAPIVVK